MQKAQKIVVKRLNTHADAIYRRVVQRSEPIGRHVFGICLHRNLGLRLEFEICLQRLEYVAQLYTAELTGCAPTYINSSRARVKQFVTTCANFALQCHNILLAPLSKSRREEIAVDTPRLAERHVYVEPDLSHASADN